MNMFIELTTGGRLVFVNTDQIAYFYPFQNLETMLVFAHPIEGSETRKMLVEEDYETVKDLIKNGGEQ